MVTEGSGGRRVSLKVARVCEHTFLTSPLGAHSMVVDLGANLGEFTRHVVGRFGCRVLAVEPAPELWPKLPRCASVDVLAVAIAGHNGVLSLKVHATRCPSALHAIDAGGLIGAHQVESVSFGELLRRADVERIDLAKVDIEGAEIAMFDGASDEELLRVAQFTVEFHDFLFPELRSDVARVKARLRKLGFACINFSLDNTDVLFINRRLLRVGALSYTWLKSVTKYGRGVERRLGARAQACAGGLAR